MMQLYFIRHAQSSNNLLWDATGSSFGRSDDPELTKIGKRQAKFIAKWLAKSRSEIRYNGRDAQNLAGFGLTHLYSSLMLRAISTGIEISRKLCLPLRGWIDLHEGGGIYLEDYETGEKVGRPGKDRDFLMTGFPDLLLPPEVGKMGWWNRPYETLDECTIRAERVINELLKLHGDTEDRVAFISHGGFFSVFMRVLLRMPEDNEFWFTMNNCGITRIDIAGGEMELVYANRLEHLPRELIT
jgi:2,3-bisphosphoglycerate-dependent phosphoglycerate mutase